MNTRDLMTRLAGMDDEDFETVRWLTEYYPTSAGTFVQIVAEMRAITREQGASDDPAT